MPEQENTGSSDELLLTYLGSAALLCWDELPPKAQLTILDQAGDVIGLTQFLTFAAGSSNCCCVAPGSEANRCVLPFNPRNGCGIPKAICRDETASPRQDKGWSEEDNSSAARRSTSAMISERCPGASLMKAFNSRRLSTVSLDGAPSL